MTVKQSLKSAIVVVSIAGTLPVVSAFGQPLLWSDNTGTVENKTGGWSVGFSGETATVVTPAGNFSQDVPQITLGDPRYPGYGINFDLPSTGSQPAFSAYDSGALRSGDELDLRITYRSPGTFYWLGSVGSSYPNMQNFLDGVGTDEDLSLNLGGGLGLRLGSQDDFNVELEFSGNGEYSEFDRVSIGATLLF